jgi:hypothetical protein
MPPLLDPGVEKGIAGFRARRARKPQRGGLVHGLGAPARIEQGLTVEALQILVLLRTIVLDKLAPAAILGQQGEPRPAQRLGGRGAVVIAQKDAHFPGDKKAHALFQILLGQIGHKRIVAKRGPPGEVVRTLPLGQGLFGLKKILRLISEPKT